VRQGVVQTFVIQLLFLGLKKQLVEEGVEHSTVMKKEKVGLN